MYAVFSEKGETTTIHSAHKDFASALVQMVRYIFFANYGEVPYSVLHSIAETAEKFLVEAKKDSIAVKVNQTEWYVEKISESVLLELGAA